MTDTTGRRIRIESALDTNRKTHALSHTRIHVTNDDGTTTDISDDILAIDWHADAKSIPVATLQIYAPGLEAEALEADTVHAPTALRAGFTQTEAFRALETQITAATQALQQLIMQTALACATCLHEERGGTRAGHNLANTIVDGTAYCNEHLDDVGGRLVPRKTSGLIITGG